jgi:hypothetical protein
MKTATITSFHLRNPMNQSRVRLVLILIPLLLGCFAVSPARAAGGDLGNLIGGHQWLVRAAAFTSQGSLTAAFNRDGSFKGLVREPSNSFSIPTQQVTGTWSVAGNNVLLLQWDWVTGPGNMKSTYHNEVPILITNASARKLIGITQWMDQWTFDRIEN